MAVPKRKTSSHRQGRRRAQQKVELPQLTTCPACGSKKLSHFACPNCGEYQSKKKIGKK